MAKSIDWEGVERDWRAGIKTKLYLSKEYGVSRAAMDKRFAKLGIGRDLAEKINARAEFLVTASVTQNEPVAAAKEARIIEANAAIQAVVVMQQRRNIARATGIVQQLFDELELLIGGTAELEQIADILASEDDGKMQDLLKKVSALPTKTDVVKKLAESLRILVELERKVLRIKDEEENKGGSIEDFLRMLPQR